MAKNNLMQFGEDAKELSTYDGSATGAIFSDEQWEASASGTYATIRKTGFVPGTPSSSVALNTALKQACYGAYILGELISTNKITDLNTTISSQNLGDVTNHVDKLVNYLKKIQDLINGSIPAKEASKALNYDTTQGTIQEKFTELSENINNIVDGTTTVKTATNYNPHEGNINTKISYFSQQLDNLWKRVGLNECDVWVCANGQTPDPTKDTKLTASSTVTQASGGTGGHLEVTAKNGVYYASRTIWGSITTASTYTGVDRNHVLVCYFTCPFDSIKRSGQLIDVGKFYYQGKLFATIRIKPVTINSIVYLGIYIVANPTMNPMAITSKSITFCIDANTVNKISTPLLPTYIIT